MVAIHLVSNVDWQEKKKKNYNYEIISKKLLRPKLLSARCLQI